MKISIIIPVYNVEEYIDKCLRSIFNQNLGKELFEVIVVNDGTPDKSMDIVKEYAIQYPNLHIVEKKNGGVSSARNAGMEFATGEYLTFVDPDDWIAQGSLKKAYDRLQNDITSDVMIFQENLQSGIERYPWKANCTDGVIYSGVSTFQLGYRRGSVCGGFYRRAFLAENAIYFPLGVRNGEDSIVISLIMTYARQVIFYHIPYYIVYERAGSASRSFTIENLRMMKQMLDAVLKIIHERNPHISIEQQDILTEMLYNRISGLTYTSISVGKLSLKNITDNISLREYLPIHYKGKNTKGWKLTLLNSSYTLYYWFIRLKLHKLCFNL